MDLGKIKLPLSRTYNGDPEASLQDLYTALNVLRTELDLTAGAVSFPASVVITKGQAVNLDGGHLRLATATTPIFCVGIAASTGAVGERVRCILGAGYLGGLTGLTPGRIVYLGAAGALTFTRPASGIVQALGFTMSATEMFVFINTDPAADAGGGGGGGGSSIDDILAMDVLL